DLFDPRPAEIRAALARRDNVAIDDDYVAVYLDPGRGGNTAQYFGVNAKGVKDDGVFTESATGGVLNMAPDFPFEVVAEVTERGARLKLRIPFASISYGETGRPWRM